MFPSRCDLRLCNTSTPNIRYMQSCTPCISRLCFGDYLRQVNMKSWVNPRLIPLEYKIVAMAMLLFWPNRWLLCLFWGARWSAAPWSWRTHAVNTRDPLRSAGCMGSPEAELTGCTVCAGMAIATLRISTRTAHYGSRRIQAHSSCTHASWCSNDIDVNTSFFV